MTKTKTKSVTMAMTMTNKTKNKNKPMAITQTKTIVQNCCFYLCVFAFVYSCVLLVATRLTLEMKYGVSNNGLFRGEGVTPVCTKKTHHQQTGMFRRPDTTTVIELFRAFGNCMPASIWHNSWSFLIASLIQYTEKLQSNSATSTNRSTLLYIVGS